MKYLKYLIYALIYALIYVLIYALIYADFLHFMPWCRLLLFSKPSLASGVLTYPLYLESLSLTSENSPHTVLGRCSEFCHAYDEPRRWHEYLTPHRYDQLRSIICRRRIYGYITQSCIREGASSDVHNAGQILSPSSSYISSCFYSVCLDI